MQGSCFLSCVPLYESHNADPYFRVCSPSADMFGPGGRTSLDRPTRGALMTPHIRRALSARRQGPMARLPRRRSRLHGSSSTLSSCTRHGAAPCVCCTQGALLSTHVAIDVHLVTPGRPCGRARWTRDTTPRTCGAGGTGSTAMTPRSAAPLPRTNRTSLVPPLVLSGHAAVRRPRRSHPCLWPLQARTKARAARAACAPAELRAGRAA
jgi:hypothetical protein